MLAGLDRSLASLKVELLGAFLVDDATISTPFCSLALLQIMAVAVSSAYAQLAKRALFALRLGAPLGWLIQLDHFIATLVVRLFCCFEDAHSTAHAAYEACAAGLMTSHDCLRHLLPASLACRQLRALDSMLFGILWLQEYAASLAKSNSFLAFRSMLRSCRIILLDILPAGRTGLVQGCLEPLPPVLNELPGFRLFWKLLAGNVSHRFNQARFKQDVDPKRLVHAWLERHLSHFGPDDCEGLAAAAFVNCLAQLSRKLLCFCCELGNLGCRWNCTSIACILAIAWPRAAGAGTATAEITQQWLALSS